MWLDDDLDPDDEESRKLMMQALDEAETGRASPSAQPIKSVENTAVRGAASGHSYHSGLPRLVCSVPWGLMLLREANAAHSAVCENEHWDALDARGELRVSVDWGNLLAAQVDGVCSLLVRRGGIEIAREEGFAPAPLSVTFSADGSTAGEPFVAELKWSGGTRHLHCLAPLRAPLKLDGLLVFGAPAGKWGMLGKQELLATHEAPGLPRLAYLPDRGLGVEMELLTYAPEPSQSGCFTKEEEVRSLITQTIERECRSVDGNSSRLRRLLDRCIKWTHEVDTHIMVSAESIGERAVRELRIGSASMTEVGELGDENGGGSMGSDGLARLLCGGLHTMKSEFKSPPPSEGALNFCREGAHEIECFVRVLKSLGAGAPALSATANGGCSLHVHVNVRNKLAGGDALSCAEILDVYFSWIRFDLVLARFARPWMWREPSMAPLYATGSEFAWQELAWTQGSVEAADRKTYDVPLFVRAVRAIYAEHGFQELAEDEKLERLFGRDARSPASGIGRYCSLNLRRLTSYGTLEFRRMNGTLDEDILVRWAHFCVAFVECFRTSGRGTHLIEAPTLEEALASLAVEQELAKPAQLMEEMAGFVDRSTAKYFMRDSGAQ
jgi:hypothetical protein